MWISWLRFVSLNGLNDLNIFLYDHHESELITSWLNEPSAAGTALKLSSSGQVLYCILLAKSRSHINPYAVWELFHMKLSHKSFSWQPGFPLLLCWQWHTGSHVTRLAEAAGSRGEHVYLRGECRTLLQRFASSSSTYACVCVYARFVKNSSVNSRLKLSVTGVSGFPACCQ